MASFKSDGVWWYEFYSAGREASDFNASNFNASKCQIGG